MYVAGRSSQCTRGWAGTRSHYTTQDWGEILHTWYSYDCNYTDMHTHYSLRRRSTWKATHTLKEVWPNFTTRRKNFRAQILFSYIHGQFSGMYLMHRSHLSMLLHISTFSCINKYIHIYIRTFKLFYLFLYSGIMFHGFFLWWEIGLLDWDGRYSMYVNTSIHTYIHTHAHIHTYIHT